MVDIRRARSSCVSQDFWLFYKRDDAWHQSHMKSRGCWVCHSYVVVCLLTCRSFKNTLTRPHAFSCCTEQHVANCWCYITFWDQCSFILCFFSLLFSVWYRQCICSRCCVFVIFSKQATDELRFELWPSVMYCWPLNPSSSSSQAVVHFSHLF